MNDKSINELVGSVDLDDSLLTAVSGGQCSTTVSTGCVPSTTSGPRCGGGGDTTIMFSCTPPGTFCP